MNSEHFESLKILVVEDDERRLGGLQQWTKSIQSKNFHKCRYEVVWARAAGAAIGLLRRDRGRVYAGIMLDHDLVLQEVTERDDLFNGKDVVDAVIEYVDKDVPIFVHSANTTESPKMVKHLEGAGFAVERVAFGELRLNMFQDWLEYVCECSQEIT